MANLFSNVSSAPQTQRQALVNKYSAARSNLLIVVAFSLVNILMLVTNSGTYFLFSASVPYLLTDIGMGLCGMYPPEYYEGLEGMYILDKSVFVILLVISLLILGVYLICWIFSKKKCGFLITALVLFSIDTVVMLLSYGLSSIVDLIFHVWIIVILSIGINAHFKLKKLPPEENVIEGEFNEISENGEANPALSDSVALRPVDPTVKARIFIEYEMYGYQITYRRVKRTNELVINGYVYAEYTALMEMPHMLNANLGGHSFAAGTDGTTSRSIMMVDGMIVKTKMRWY